MEYQLPDPAPPVTAPAQRFAAAPYRLVDNNKPNRPGEDSKFAIVLPSAFLETVENSTLRSRLNFQQPKSGEQIANLTVDPKPKVLKDGSLEYSYLGVSTRGTVIEKGTILYSRDGEPLKIVGTVSDGKPIQGEIRSVMALESESSRVALAEFRKLTPQERANGLVKEANEILPRWGSGVRNSPSDEQAALFKRKVVETFGLGSQVGLQFVHSANGSGLLNIKQGTETVVARGMMSMPFDANKAASEGDHFARVPFELRQTASGQLIFSVFSRFERPQLDMIPKGSNYMIEKADNKSYFNIEPSKDARPLEQLRAQWYRKMNDYEDFPSSTRIAFDMQVAKR